ncbi:MAG: hypothetical protein KDK78_10485, partial [Chlamydiia bacterium]|nr:hypothetical protein [Chlamydiia bacterium]
QSERVWRWVRSPLRSFYSYRGKKQTAHYKESYGKQLLREDGTIDHSAKKQLEHALNDRLVEKIRHYDEEGVKYLKIYACGVLIVISVVVGGAIVTSTVASGGTATPAVLCAAGGIAATTAIISAIVTATLFAYRIDAKRKHIIKGTADVFVAKFQRDQQHIQEQECARYIAETAFAQALEQILGEEAEWARLSMTKVKDITSVIIQSMVANESKTIFLKKWTASLREATQEALDNPPEELQERLDYVTAEVEKEADNLEYVDEEEAASAQAIALRAAHYHAAKAWIAPRVLAAAAQPLAEILLAAMYTDDNDLHVHIHSSQALRDLRIALNGVPRPASSVIHLLERRNQRLEAEIRDLRQEIRSLRSDFQQIQRPSL